MSTFSLEERYVLHVFRTSMNDKMGSLKWDTQFKPKEIRILS